ncbi:hypothetical protein P691DRAFT_768086 [Macrolepiota fuliginosa MF-IS2]|uniref:Uncharacterized protein n=1 Tax=Macrolepiota fuliginosa MF-IS2 TaxID=1400762 RepID=A0A9P5WYS5_9AGAR|nr:hypothetical protein P691DRAFT_768086 [Macrolepiota fuliginosa MF-IS2]
MTPQDEPSHPISDPTSTNNAPTINHVKDSPQQSTQFSPSDPTTTHSPPLIPSPSLLLIKEVVFSDDESDISPMMAISLPPPNLLFWGVLRERHEPEPKPEPEPVIRKGHPTTLSLDGTIFTQPPYVESGDLSSSNVAVSGEEPGVVEGILDVNEEDAGMEEAQEVEAGPSPGEAGVEAIEAGIETVEAVDVPQIPSSPTTPGVPRLSLSSTQQSAPSQLPGSLLSPLSSLGTSNGSLIRPASMVEFQLKTPESQTEEGSQASNASH